MRAAAAPNRIAAQNGMNREAPASSRSGVNACELIKLARRLPRTEGPTNAGACLTVRLRLAIDGQSRKLLPPGGRQEIPGRGNNSREHRRDRARQARASRAK